MNPSDDQWVTSLLCGVHDQMPDHVWARLRHSIGVAVELRPESSVSGRPGSSTSVSSAEETEQVTPLGELLTSELDLDGARD